MKKIFSKTFGLALFSLFVGVQNIHANERCSAPTMHRGILGLKIKIGEKEFLDLLNITRSCMVGWTHGTIDGNLNVPELFSTKIINGTYFDMIGGGENSVTYTFDIETVENGKPLKASYRVTDSSNHETKKNTCTGEVLFEGETTPIAFQCFRYQVDAKYL